MTAAVLAAPMAVAAPMHTVPATPDSAVVSAATDSTTLRSPSLPDSGGAAPHVAPRDIELSDSGEVAPVRHILPPPTRFEQPRWVMLRSLLVPGWGQAHNRAWIKASLLAVGDGTLRWRLVSDERKLTRLNNQALGRASVLAGADAQLTLAQAELSAAEAAGDTARIVAAQQALLAANLSRNGASDAYNDAVGAYNALLDGSINRRWLAAGVIVYALLDAYVDAHFRSFDVNFKVDPALPGGKTPGARVQIGWRF